MLTRDQALHNLNLSHEAGKEEIEQSYRRLVRRYPPEFHPDRFRQIDESYRILTSLSFRVESIFNTKHRDEEENLARQVAELPMEVDAETVAQGVAALRRFVLQNALWPRGRSGR
jgi:curved DNA-binding protein CbpA